MRKLECVMRSFLFAFVVVLVCNVSNAQPIGEEEVGAVPDSVQVVSVTLNGSGLTNGIGYLQTTADYSASRAAGEVPCTITSSLTIDEGESESPKYFDMTYSFQITQNQTCTWTLSSPTCNTLTSGQYRALAFISGCGQPPFDFEEDFSLLFD